MAELLHGPWLIAVTYVDQFPEFSFVISGATEPNGRHPVEAGYEVEADGEEWSIEMEIRGFDGEDWEPVEKLRRETKFVPLRGLSVILDNRPKPPDGEWFGPLWMGATLTCTSQDPDIATVPSGSVPDFTIPGE